MFSYEDAPKADSCLHLVSLIGTANSNKFFVMKGFQLSLFSYETVLKHVFFFASIIYYFITAPLLAAETILPYLASQPLVTFGAGAT